MVCTGHWGWTAGPASYQRDDIGTICLDKRYNIPASVMILDTVGQNHRAKNVVRLGKKQKRLQRVEKSIGEESTGQTLSYERVSRM